MDAGLSTLHAPEAAAKVVDEGCRRVRERGQIDVVRYATCVDTEDKRMAIRRTADIGAKRP
jgi:predicted enzyme related to lactoylglutathione lyase